MATEGSVYYNLTDSTALDAAKRYFRDIDETQSPAVIKPTTEEYAAFTNDVEAYDAKMAGYQAKNWVTSANSVMRAVQMVFHYLTYPVRTAYYALKRWHFREDVNALRDVDCLSKALERVEIQRHIEVLAQPLREGTDADAGQLEVHHLDMPQPVVLQIQVIGDDLVPPPVDEDLPPVEELVEVPVLPPVDHIAVLDGMLEDFTVEGLAGLEETIRNLRMEDGALSEGLFTLLDGLRDLRLLPARGMLRDVERQSIEGALSRIAASVNIIDGRFRDLLQPPSYWTKGGSWLGKETPEQKRDRVTGIIREAIVAYQEGKGVFTEAVHNKYIEYRDIMFTRAEELSASFEASAERRANLNAYGGEYYAHLAAFMMSRVYPVRDRLENAAFAEVVRALEVELVGCDEKKGLLDAAVVRATELQAQWTRLSQAEPLNHIALKDCLAERMQVMREIEEHMAALEKMRDETIPTKQNAIIVELERFTDSVKVEELKRIEDIRQLHNRKIVELQRVIEDVRIARPRTYDSTLDALMAEIERARLSGEAVEVRLNDHKRQVEEAPIAREEQADFMVRFRQEQDNVDGVLALRSISIAAEIRQHVIDFDRRITNGTHKVALTRILGDLTNVVVPRVEGQRLAKLRLYIMKVSKSNLTFNKKVEVLQELNNLYDRLVTALNTSFASPENMALIQLGYQQQMSWGYGADVSDAFIREILEVYDGRVSEISDRDRPSDDVLDGEQAAYNRLQKLIPSDVAPREGFIAAVEGVVDSVRAVSNWVRPDLDDEATEEKLDNELVWSSASWNLATPLLGADFNFTLNHDYTRNFTAHCAKWERTAGIEHI